jgi:hypothetical protein
VTFRPLRCAICGRIRLEVCGVEAWADRPGLVPGEVAGMCVTCRVRLEASREQSRKAADRQARAERRAGKTYGETVADPFENFRDVGEVATWPLASQGGAVKEPSPNKTDKRGK